MHMSLCIVRISGNLSLILVCLHLEDILAHLQSKWHVQESASALACNRCGEVCAGFIEMDAPKGFIEMDAPEAIICTEF